MDDLLHYSDVKSECQNQTTHLLLGNGFSIDCGGQSFSYEHLASELVFDEDDLISSVYSAIGGKNFEMVMRQLDYFMKLQTSLDLKPEVVKKIKKSTNKVRSEFVKSITIAHPEKRKDVDFELSKEWAMQIKSVLDNGGKVFTLNYDLMLYWICGMHGCSQYGDGFGRENSLLMWGPTKEIQSIFFMHGALHLFDNGSYVEKETSDGSGQLFENVATRIQGGEYPLVVSGGTKEAKMSQISENEYLKYCYESFSCLQGVLVCYGCSFSSMDGHIIDAINNAVKLNGIERIYLSVFDANDLLSKKALKSKFNCKVELFKSSSMY